MKGTHLLKLRKNEWSEEAFTLQQGVIRLLGRLYVGTTQGWRQKLIKKMHDRWALRNAGNIPKGKTGILLAKNEEICGLLHPEV
jgi:hypothetical protein